MAENADVDRYRRKVIHEGRKLRIWGLEITVRQIWTILCWKSVEIEGRNLEAHDIFRTFALSKDLMTQAGGRPPDVVGRNDSNTMKNTIKREQTKLAWSLPSVSVFVG